MDVKSKTLFLIICGLSLMIAFPTIADNSRKDNHKQTWRNKHDSDSFEKTWKGKNRGCGREQSCFKANKKEKAKNKHLRRPHQDTRQPKNSWRRKNNKKRHNDKHTTHVTTPKPVILNRHHVEKHRIKERHSDTPQWKERRLNKRHLEKHLREERRLNKRHLKAKRIFKRPRHRITYADHIRHDHRYIRGPWYSTRYISYIPRHRHKIGFRLKRLPRHHTKFFIGGLPYFYYTGVFYRSFGSSYIAVAAPFGAFVKTLPVGFIAFTIGFSIYYYVNDNYYTWDEEREGYIVVAKPTGATEAMKKATADRLIVYPNEDQSDAQQAKDRYECHRWAVTESGIDPTLEDQEYAAQDRDIYRRAIAACLEGRGYTVK